MNEYERSWQSITKLHVVTYRIHTNQMHFLTFESECDCDCKYKYIHVVGSWCVNMYVELSVPLGLATTSEVYNVWQAIYVSYQLQRNVDKECMLELLKRKETKETSVWEKTGDKQKWNGEVSTEREREKGGKWKMERKPRWNRNKYT